jgi:diguanylate cyclase (GGDEF)-like protein/PAS domain S-box-containing protein
MKERLSGVLRKALSAVGEGVCIVDGQGDIVFVNKALCEIYGYLETELLGRQWRLLWDEAAEGAAIMEDLEKGTEQRWEGDFSHRGKDGKPVSVSLTVTLAGEAEESGPFFIAVGTERKGKDRLEAAMDRLSRQDELTLLPDRSRFQEVLEQEWRRGQRQDLPLAVIMIDIDHFGAYNEKHGSRAGNAVLRALAAEIGGHVKRSGDLTARSGGSEFAVILPGMDRESAARFAESLREGIEVLKIAHPSSPHGGVVTVSLGVSSMIPVRGASLDLLIDQAGKALSRAKVGGRNQVSVAGTDQK